MVELGLSRMTLFGQKETIKNFKGMVGKSQKAAIQRTANRARHGKLKNKTTL
jgi:hypothetical protein